MLTEDYVSLETAKLLKEKGFPQDPYICNTVYKPNGKFCINAKSFWNPFCFALLNREYYMTPTLGVACKWLREFHNLNVEVYRTACGYIGCIVAIPSGTDIKFLEDDGDDKASGTYTKPELAYEATIKYCLEYLI